MAKKPPEGAPWVPPDYELADAVAINAIARGEATADQQIRGMKWIVEKLCATYDLEFRPDEAGGDRATAFASGRRFVGLMLRKFIGNLEPIRAYFAKRKDNQHDSHRTPGR